jgi:hypothetical protein
MRTGFVYAADKGCEGIFVGLAQTSEFDKSATYIWRFHIVGLAIPCIVLSSCLQNTRLRITTEPEKGQ